jgi:Spy/CpxP family protein refolding chaperone
MEKLRALLDQHRVDEDQVLARAEEVAGLEATLKRRHLALLVRIKNVLTEEQQEALGQLRGRGGRGKPGRREGRRPLID